jgi:hypothetical protein
MSDKSYADSEHCSEMETIRETQAFKEQAGQTIVDDEYLDKLYLNQ